MFRRYCQIHSFRFSISTHCKQLEPGLALLYPALSTTSRKYCAEWSIESKYSGKTGAHAYVCYENGGLIYDTQLVDDALDYLEWRITTRILQELSHFVQIHAAGLVSGGKALLLVGPPGAGKSSLAVCLLRQGWKCLSDEVILIDSASGTAWPFLRSFRVDSKAVEAFPEFFVKQGGPAYCDSKGKIRLDPSLVLRDWVAQPSQPRWIIFPGYQPGHRGELEPLGETEAFHLMMSQAINLAEHGKRGMDTLISLVRRFQCFRLNTGDLHTATSLLEGLTEQMQKSIYRSGQTSGGGFIGGGVPTTVAGGSHE